MAVMIPRHPKEFDPKSKEDEVFRALQALPNEYYIFHSVSLLKVFKTITNLVQEGYARKDIVVLSLKGESSKMNIGNDRVNGVRYITINRFKGLEAKAVIIVDFDQSTFDRRPYMKK